VGVVGGVPVRPPGPEDPRPGEGEKPPWQGWDGHDPDDDPDDDEDDD